MIVCDKEDGGVRDGFSKFRGKRERGMGVRCMARNLR